MEEQTSKVFRKQSLDRIASPEQLNDYLRVTDLGVWAVLAAIILLLGGVLAWSMTGYLETVTDSVAVVENGQAQITVNDRDEIRSGMTVRIADAEYTVSTVDEDALGRTVAYAPVDALDGRYDVVIVTERIHPISFLFG